MNKSKMKRTVTDINADALSIGRVKKYLYRKITVNGESCMDLLRKDELNMEEIKEAFYRLVDIYIDNHNRVERMKKFLKENGIKPMTTEEQRNWLKKISRPIS